MIYTDEEINKVIDNLYVLKKEFNRNAKEHSFWDITTYNKDLQLAIISQKICLIHSELSEALEELRKDNLNNDFFLQKK